MTVSENFLLEIEPIILICLLAYSKEYIVVYKVVKSNVSMRFHGENYSNNSIECFKSHICSHSPGVSSVISTLKYFFVITFTVDRIDVNNLERGFVENLADFAI